MEPFEGLLNRFDCSTSLLHSHRSHPNSSNGSNHSSRLAALLLLCMRAAEKKATKHNVKIKQSAMVSLYLLFLLSSFSFSALLLFFRYIISTLFLSPPCGGSCCVLFALRSFRTFENHNELKNYKRNL